MNVKNIEDAWDARYDHADYQYGISPNSFLAQAAAEIPPGSAVLSMADGEGRNGVWLATQGHQVTTVDASGVGVAKARKLAAQHDVTIDAIHGGLPADELKGRTFDAIVSIFFHMPEPMRVAVHQQAISLLNPGGLFILEAYTPQQLTTQGRGGPPMAELLYTAAMLKQDFEGFEWVQIEELDVDMDEGELHQGASHVVRMIARKQPT